MTNADVAALGKNVDEHSHDLSRPRNTIRHDLRATNTPDIFQTISLIIAWFQTLITRRTCLAPHEKLARNAVLGPDEKTARPAVLTPHEEF